VEDKESLDSTEETEKTKERRKTGKDPKAEGTLRGTKRRENFFFSWKWVHNC
jgi:hypothetical protein